MRHRKAKITLDRTASQRRPLLRNLAISLITHERITTTAARARATKSYVERLVTTAKGNTLHARRQVLRVLNNAAAADKLVTKLGPRFKERHGGYLRSVNLGPRSGDGAQRVLIEFIPPKA